jgi:hypothetical protein
MHRVGAKSAIFVAKVASFIRDCYRIAKKAAVA